MPILSSKSLFHQNAPFFTPVLILLLFGLPAAAQQKTPKDSARLFWSNELGSIAYMPESEGWYRFKPNTVKESKRLFIQHKKAFGLGNDDSMQLTQTLKDGSGSMHHRFQQYYKGIRIEGAEYLVHEQNGFATSASGKLVRQLQKSAQPTISNQAAFAGALRQVPAGAYKLTALSKQTFTPGTYQSPAQLVYQRAHTNLSLLPENLKLCYRYEIYTETGEGYIVYIDAQTGTLVNKLPLQSECAPTSVATNFNGTKPINTTASGSGYYLQDGCTPTNIAVYNNSSSVSYSGYLYSSATNTGWNATADLRSAATSLWACRRTADFYSQVLGRKGYDAAGGDVSVYQNAGFSSGAGVYYNNASMTFNGGSMKIGNNGTTSNLDDWNTIDIVAHEFTHAVTGASSKLVYQGEPGALNESYSDIMGVYAEYWDGSLPFDWLMGEDRGAPFRSLQNPGQYGHPNTYKSPLNWYTGTADYGGVHQNSGVQNYWFYLLCNGGSGTNDNGKTYSVNGIGIANAGFIAYMTNAFYLTSESDYIDARNQSIQVAIDYFGSCSVAALETAKAWYAVGVGGAQTGASNQNVCGDFTASATALRFRGIDVLPVSNGCLVTLNKAQNPYLFTASKTVVLYPGFKALEGATVNIYIDSCNITLNTYTANVQRAQPQTSAAPVPEWGVASISAAPALTAFPNPASNQTQLILEMPYDAGRAVIELYDLHGRPVRSIGIGQLQAGRQTVPLQLHGLAQGTYTAVLRAASASLRTRIVVLRK